MFTKIHKAIAELRKNKIHYETCLAIRQQFERDLKDMREEFQASITAVRKEQIEQNKKDKETLLLEMDKRLETFKGLITEKYMSSIERLFDFMKEMAVLISLNSTKQDVVSLRRQIIKPLLAERAAFEEEKKGLELDRRLKTTGEKLLAKRKQMYDDMLKAERQGHSTEVAKLKAKIEIADSIIGDKL
jgi:hypothetical protein